MMRLTFLMLFGNAIFYLIQAVSCCRILTRRFSWPVMVPGFAVGYLLFVLPAIPFPETGMIRGMIALVSFPLVDMVLFRDKWYRCLFCGVAAVCTMSLNGMGQPTTGTDCGRSADAGAAAPGADLSAHSGAVDVLCHLPVGIGIFPVDVHPADEPL